MDEDDLHELMAGKGPEERAAESAAALAVGDHSKYVLLMHGRDRLLRFQEVEAKLDDATYWRLLAEVYSTVERPGGEVFHLLRSDRPQRECFMTDDERAVFEALPEVLDLWRGDTEHDDLGWAWSLDRGIAEWFARQRERVYGGRARVRASRARKTEAVGYLTRRGEAEIVIDPERVRDLCEMPVALPPLERS